MPKVAFTTLGCKVNQSDSEALIGLFRAQGYDVVAFTQKADVYVINTCSVTNLSERKSRQMIRRTTGTNPDAVVVVTGCYAQAAAEKVAAMPGVDIIVGANERGRIVGLAEAARKNKHQEQINLVSDIMENTCFEDIPLLFAPERTRAFLKIQDGCESYCTYCIIPQTRGPLRSRSAASILSEAQKLVAAGFKEIVLTGIHLGAYGRDLPGDNSLADAVEILLGLKELVRLRLGSLEGVEVSDKLVQLMKEDKRLCPHLHLPLQSGDNDILKAMNRQYTTACYRQTAEKIRREIPDIALTTDIITGFPGENEEKFMNTVNFAASMRFARVHIFPYSQRTGTLAAGYQGQIAEKEKKRRAQILQQLSLQQANAFQASFVGRRMEVLFEDFAPKGVFENTLHDYSGENTGPAVPNREPGIIEGLTGNYLRVYASGDADYLGELKVVEIQEFHNGKLWGKILK